jgi:hypothetical protein
MVPVPPLIAITLGTLAAALVVRHFAKEWRRDADLAKAKEAPRAESKTDVPKLRRDADGIYRP